MDMKSESRTINAELLKRNAIHSWKTGIPAAVVTSADFVPICFEHCLHMWPMVEWIHENVSAVQGKMRG